MTLTASVQVGKQLTQLAAVPMKPVAAGGHRIGNRGYFYAATVLAEVSLEAGAMNIEPFGPLGVCVPVPNLDQALALATSLSVGLAGYAFTNSPTTRSGSAVSSNAAWCPSTSRHGRCGHPLWGCEGKRNRPGRRDREFVRRHGQQDRAAKHGPGLSAR
jgi:acyl-CoA reductase-like NAD-dependent aldehyde dehydrogenase